MNHRELASHVFPEPRYLQQLQISNVLQKILRARFCVITSPR